MKLDFFHRFDIAVYAEPFELKNIFMCQLWHVGRLRVKECSEVRNAFPKTFVFLSTNVYVCILWAKGDNSTWTGVLGIESVAFQSLNIWLA